MKAKDQKEEKRGCGTWQSNNDEHHQVHRLTRGRKSDKGKEGQPIQTLNIGPKFTNHTPGAAKVAFPAGRLETLSKKR